MNFIDRKGLFRELRRSLETLALSGNQALQTEPEDCCRADELALDYDNAVGAVLGNFSLELRRDQVEALKRVNNLLSEMSGAQNAHLWTDEGVCESPRWAEVRGEAQLALRLMGWK